MRLHHEADLDAPVDRVWERALDPREVAAAFPGGRITRVEDDGFSGQVSVGVGLLRLTYEGDGRYEETDAALRRAVIVAEGRQRRGPGRADIRITLRLTEAADARTHAELDTDLVVNGSSLPLAGPLGEKISAPLVAAFLRRLGRAG